MTRIDGPVRYGVMKSRENRFNRSNAVVIAIIAAGVLLRVYGMSWDEGLYLHPDERFIAIVSSERVDAPKWNDIGSILRPADSPLNPRRDGPDGRPLSFAYGTLPVYVQSVVSWIVNFIAHDDYQSYRHLYKVGRPLTVLMDSLTMLFVFLLTRRLFGQLAGMLAVALYAFSVLAIQLSHFFTVDVWLTAFVTASLYFAVRYIDHPSMGRALAMSAPVGCAFATKASVPALLVPLLVAAVWTLWRSVDRLRTFRSLALSGLVALVIFTLFEPYALVRPAPFIEDIGLQSRIVRGHYDVPFTRQFVGLTPGVYELQNLFKFSLGPAFTVAAIAGVIFATRRSIRTRDIGLLVLCAWTFAYAVTILLTEAKFLRYALPLIPVFAVFASGFLQFGLRRYPRGVSWGASATVVGVTLVWALGFVSIYGSEHPRIAASKWMHANVPPGSAVSVEAWDDALPLPYQGAPPMSYRQITFDMYGDEPPERKVETLAESLQSVDYVILSSNRIIDSVDNLPWRYAVQSEFYRRLLEGQLGFQLVYDAELRPNLLGYQYDDSSSDESFTVYDHPRVRIFQKVESLTTADVRDRLLWGIEQPWVPQRYPAEKTLRLQSPVSEIDSTRDASWNGTASRHQIVAVLSWLFVFELLGLAVLPLAALVLRNTLDRGAFSARLIGLLLIGWIGWLSASIGVWRSLASYHWLVLVTTAAGIWLWYWRSADRPALPGVRTYAVGSAVWLGILSFFLLLRATYPDFWQTWFGGEKPFELAYLRAISQSTSFPPYDPWFADGVINYYYYGWHLIATVTKLSGVGVELGFQLAIASLAALLALQATSLGSMLIRRGRDRIRHGPALISGGVVAFAALLAGNLDAVQQVFAERALFFDTFDFWRSTRVISYAINEFPYFSFLWADVHPHVINFPILMLLITLLSSVVLRNRQLPDTRMLPVLAVTALVLGSIGVTNSWDAPLAIGLTLVSLTYLGLLRGSSSGLAGLSVGLIVVAVSFAMFAPFYLGFYSVVEGVQRTSAGSSLGEFLAVWGIFLSIIVLAIVHRTLVRVRDSVSVRDALAFAVMTLSAGTLAQIVALLRGDGGPRGEAVIALTLSSLVISLAALSVSPSRFHTGALGLIVLSAVASGGIATYRPVSAVALSFVAAATIISYTVRRQPSQLVPWALIGVAGLILAGTEVMYVADDLQRSPWERMNTIFKFYLQAWLLLAIACGVFCVRMISRARFPELGSLISRNRALGILAMTPRDQARPEATMNSRATLSQRIVVALAIVVLCLGLVYPLAGTPVRLNQDMPSSPTELTLDGYAWMDGGYIHNHTGDLIVFTGDLHAIQWLNANVSGTPVILEAAIGPYRGNGGRISSATGLPAVLGWDRHQRQQRYEAGIAARMVDIRSIYNDTDPARKLELLRRYRVEYVVVGDVERYWNHADDTSFYASAAGLAALESMVGQELTIVFESESTRIYRVNDFPRIAPAPDAVQQL